jgi:hypothetical protein
VKHELAEQMSDLQREIENFRGGRVLGKGVFQRVAAGFVDLEAFLLDFPAEATSWVGEREDVVRGNAEIAHPAELRESRLALDEVRFTAVDHGEGMGVLLRIDIGEVIHPVKLLWRRRITTRGEP